MSTPEWEQTITAALSGLVDSHRYRTRRVFRPTGPTHVEWQGRQLVNFASNNYLGLTHHPRVLAAASLALYEDGAGSGAAALITGYTPRHASAEQTIAQWKGTAASVLLPSGYQANHAAIQTLAAIAERTGNGVRFLLDKLAHASLIDAVRGSGSQFRVFPHNHLGKLRRLLEASEPKQTQVVITESIFSMDGDAADLAGLAKLKAEHPFVQVVDEAHATGVYGPSGNGLAAELGLQEAVDVSVLTLSKSMGCAGGAVCGSAAFCEAVVNFSRAFIYSTSVPSSVPAAAEAAIGVMRDEPRRQMRLRELSRRVRAELAAGGVALPSGDSPILPILLGTETAALEAAQRLHEEGLLVLAIRPPTVARGTSRLRVTLSSEHTDEEIDRLVGCLVAVSQR